MACADQCVSLVDVACAGRRQGRIRGHNKPGRVMAARAESTSRLGFLQRPMSLLNDLPYLIIVGFLFCSYKLVTEPELVTQAGQAVALVANRAAEFLDIDALLPASAAVRIT